MKTESLGRPLIVKVAEVPLTILEAVGSIASFIAKFVSNKFVLENTGSKGGRYGGE